jgi:glycerol transport system ATP-binding protein
MAKITLRNLAHAYSGDPASRDDYQLKPTIDHIWDDGEAYALLGPSGCGKTTLLNIISGLLQPSQGTILFDDTDVTALPTAARNVAQVFQFPVVYDTMTVFDNLAFPLRNRGADPAYVNRRVKEIAKMIGLTADLDRRARSLTADAKQKISLGRGMVREDCAAILFDEPLTVIDPHLKWALRTELKALHREFQHTMIYVTHDQTEALTFANKVVVMLDGEVVQFGTPAALFDRPEHTFVGFFIGSPGMNVLPAKLAGDTAMVGGHRIPLGRGFAPAKGTTELGIRPEFVTLSDGDDGLPVKVTRVEDVGRHQIVRTDFDGIEVNVVIGEGDRISDRHNRLVFDPAAIHIYEDGRIVGSASHKGGDGAGQ